MFRLYRNFIDWITDQDSTNLKYKFKQFLYFYDMTKVTISKQNTSHKMDELPNSLESKNEIERTSDSSNLKTMKSESLGYSIYTIDGI